MNSFTNEIHCDETSFETLTDVERAEFEACCDQRTANAWQDREDDLQQDEYDGQPDEAQEWEDFDPDC